MNIQRKEKGFTIIEVVLVLAIAGLIFLMVFIALPALQRNQRDTARKNDASTVAAAVNSFKSNNRGSLSNLTSTRLTQYIDKLDQYDMTSSDQVVYVGTQNTANPSLEQITVRKGRKCGNAPAPGSSYTTANGTSRTAAVIVRLENNGASDGYQMYCVDV